MPETLKIRFVGGPFHNQVREAPLQQVLEMRYCPKQPGSIAASLSLANMKAIVYSSATYLLCHFRSEFGTWYQQYLHNSMIGAGGRPRLETFTEGPFPVYPGDMPCLKSK